MKRSCRVAAAVAFALTAFGVSAAEGESRATDRLDALNRALSGAPAWHAEFDQEYIPVGMTMGEKAHGQVWLAWPDRALFHTGQPPFRLMGLQGRTVRLVDLPDETCDEHQLSDREWERVPLAAVLDPRGALVHFDIVEHMDIGIVLIPKEPGGVDRVEVILGEDNLPDEVSIWDPQGAVNCLEFSDWTRSKEPPDGTWLPAAPANVECSTDPGPLD